MEVSSQLHAPADTRVYPLGEVLCAQLKSGCIVKRELPTILEVLAEVLRL
jgi:hypothetical protein